MYALFLIVLSLAMPQQNEAHNPLTKSNRTQHPSAQSQNQESGSDNDRICTNCEINGQSSKTQEEKDDEALDRLFQRTYWGITILGVFGGLALLCVVWKQGQNIVNTERAWIMADLDWTPMYQSIHTTRDSYSNVESAIDVRLRYRNDGNTPAWVDEIKARFEIVERPANRPDVERMERVKDRKMPYGPIPLRIRGREYIDIPLKCTGQEEIRKQNIVYGVIYYRDAFKRRRHTFFGFRILGQEIILLPGFPEYNKHT